LSIRGGRGDEDVFPAVIIERLSGEAAVECLHLQTRNIEESEPFVLRGHHRELVAPPSRVM
jgi:hypothetical protein